MSGRPYRESVREITVLGGGAAYEELPAEALELRGRSASVEQRRAFLRRVVRRLLTDDVPERTRLYEAEALHLIAFTLAGQVEPREQIRFLRPAIARLAEAGRRNPELTRYLGLLLRTLSMASSKMDGYTGAFADIDRAHRSLGPVGAGVLADPARRWEAEQQIHLQECGQLSRLVETALIEQDEERRRAMLFKDELPERVEPPHLAELRVVATAAAEAGRRACVLVDRISPDNATIDGEDRRLSVRTWYPTANIMYIRALLLAATVDRLCRVRTEHHLHAVPDRYAAVVESGVMPNTVLDLHRIVLHHSFLSAGNHPYALASAPRPVLPAGSRLPDCLVRPRGFQADLDACTAAIERAGQNANFLDNLGDVRTFLLFQHESGTGPRNYVQWLQRRRVRLREVASNDAGSLLEQTRHARRPTGSMIPKTAQSVRLSRRYDSVLAAL